MLFGFAFLRQKSTKDICSQKSIDFLMYYAQIIKWNFYSVRLL